MREEVALAMLDLTDSDGLSLLEAILEVPGFAELGLDGFDAAGLFDLDSTAESC